MHKLTIGDNCVISWNCQFLDEDFHEIAYAEEKKRKFNTNRKQCVDRMRSENIQRHSYSNGCVIASDSIVKGVFHVENSSLAEFGKVIKEGITWK